MYGVVILLLFRSTKASTIFSHRIPLHTAYQKALPIKFYSLVLNQIKWPSIQIRRQSQSFPNKCCSLAHLTWRVFVLEIRIFSCHYIFEKTHFGSMDHKKGRIWSVKMEYHTTRFKNKTYFLYICPDISHSQNRKGFSTSHQ